MHVGLETVSVNSLRRRGFHKPGMIGMSYSLPGVRPTKVVAAGQLGANSGCKGG